jgi:hypothetical protein
MHYNTDNKALCCALRLLPQALGPQVVRTLLLPHLEPFMSTCLFSAMATDIEQQQQQQLTEGEQRQVQQQEAAAAAAASTTNLQRRLDAAEHSIRRAEAWQVYGALLSSVGGAMYDRLLEQLHSQLPPHLLVSHRPGGGASGSSSRANGGGMTTSCAATVAEVARAAARGAAATAAAARAPGNGAALAPMDLDAAAAAAAASAAAGKSGSSGPLSAARRLHGGAAAACAGGGGSPATQPAARAASPSVLSVLGDAWREDSDVNATLGALLELFGEDLLPYLPLAEVASVTL